MGNRRFAQISTSDEEEEAPRKPSDESHPRRKRLKREGSVTSSGEEDEDEEPPQEDAKTIGDSIRLSGKGRGRRSHYEAFEFDGNRYDLVSHLLGF
uniref:Uncharacterized protein n=1 Tax=Fagus sylvatica TaxID=28930 RepID=A0A2N9FSL2_FAGSY